jgi:hypothetical protein
VKSAWSVYDQWLDDIRVKFHPQPRGTDAVLREMTRSFASQPASKAIGDCYLLAFASLVIAKKYQLGTRDV